jgi:carotenoid cleavage dioxygenase-like enzyme
MMTRTNRSSGLDRRDFLRATGTGLASGWLSACADPIGSLRAAVGEAGATPASIVRASPRELDVELTLLQGRIPGDMFGHYFMVAPVPSQPQSFVICGDGMVHRLDLAEGRVALRSRLARTPCFYAERAVAGTSAEFTTKGAARISRELGVRNQLNTAFLPLAQDRMLLCFDAGRPFEIDPVSLDLVTPVGSNQEWRVALDMPDFLRGLFVGSTFPLVKATGHPSHDPFTGETFSINHGGGEVEILGVPLLGAAFTDLVRWNGAGPLERWHLVDERGDAIRIRQSGHQIQVTERYVVVMDCAFLIEPAKMFFADAMDRQASETIIYVVDRNELASTAAGGELLARRFTIPLESPHFLADYDNPSGQLILHLPHNNAFDASEWLIAADLRHDTGEPVPRELLGMLSSTTDLNPVGYHVIDVPGGSVRRSESRYLLDPDLTWGLTLFTHPGTWPQARHDELYWLGTGFRPDLLSERVVDAYRRHPSRILEVDELPFATGKPCSLLRTSVSTGRIADGFVFPAGRLVSSPQFVPRLGGPRTGSDGYLVCSVVSGEPVPGRSTGDEFWIFDAAHLSAGPLCRLGHPELDMAYTLHTTWLPQLRPHTSDYRIDMRAELEEEVRGLSSHLRRVFETEVYPHFAT